jgi:hypothetical protein
MLKFLLNLLVQISKAFVYSKIQILFRNNSPQLLAHPAFRPSRGPFSLFLSIWLLPLFPLGFGLSAGPASPHAGGALPDCRLPHRKTPPAAPPSPTLRARLTGGPHLSSLTSGPPELGHATPRAAQPYLGRYPSFYHPAIISPSLIPVLTLPPPSIVLTPLTPPLLSLDTPLRRSPGPYKRAMRPLTLTAPHPLSRAHSHPPSPSR